MFVKREARLQDKKNRQNSIVTDDNSLKYNWDLIQHKAIESAKEAYNAALESGVAKEQARAILPEGLTRTKLYMSGTIRSWIHYVQLRAGPETQKEHRDIAIGCKTELGKVLPTLKDYL